METGKKFILIFLVLFAFGCSAKTTTKFQTSNVCITPESKITDPDKIKLDLETKALDMILNKYQDTFVKNIIFTDRFYYNLKEMNKYCLKAKVSITTSDQAKKISKIKLKDFCYSNPEIKLSELEETAVLKALQSKMFQLHPQTKQADWELINKSIFDINYSTPKIDLQNNSICFDLNAKYYPDDINLLTITKSSVKKDFLFHENFTGLKNNHQKIKQYGKDLVVKQIKNNTAVTTSNIKGSSIIFRADKISNANIKLLISKTNYPCLKKQSTIKILDIEYVNRQRDDLKLISQKINNEDICNDVVLGRQKSQNHNIQFEKEINEIEILKEDRQIKIFFNKVLAGTFLASGNTIKNIKVYLDTNTFLNEITIKEL